MGDYPRWRRRQTLVNKEYQFRFTTVLLVQMTMVILAIAAFGYLESRATLALVLRHVVDYPVSSYELHVNNQLFLFKVILVIGAAALAQFLFGLYASHKLAGPILKMTRILERAGQGDYSDRVAFRSGDHLESLAVTMNRWLETLEREQVLAQERIEAIEDEVHRLSALDSPTTEQIDGLRQRIANLAGVEIAVPVGSAS